MRTFNFYKLVPLLGAVSLALLSGCQQAQPTMLGGGAYGGGGIYGTGGCVPITSPITFSAQSIYQDYARLIGGYLPYGGAQGLGQISVGYGAQAGMTYGGYTYASQYGSDGQVQITLSQGMYGLGYNQMQLPYSGYPNQYAASYPQVQGFNSIPWTSNGSYVPGNWNPNYMSAYGTIQLSNLVMQDIMLQAQMGVFGYGTGYGTGVGTGYGYGTGYGSVPCVSGIGFQLSKWDQTGLIYNGNIYLYLNGTQHGYVLYF